jgi:predicted DCC family thiol-disulfide oxidoreductase YuxK
MTPTLLYDGDCGFCTSTARWLARRVPTRAAVLPWQQADLVALGVTAEQAAGAVQWSAPGARPLAGPDAVAALLREANGGWRLAGRLLASRPVRPLARPVYRWIARHRHQMPGGTPACALPDRPVRQTP